MSDTYDKITAARFEVDHARGLTWVTAPEYDSETERFYDIWLLVQNGTDRILVTIDGPTDKQLCYTVAVEGASGRRLYLSLDGAKRNAVSVAMQILGSEHCESARKRKFRHEMRATT